MSRSATRRRSALALLAAGSVLATVACGSTVQQSGATALGGGQQVPGAVDQGLAPVGPDGLALDPSGVAGGTATDGGSSVGAALGASSSGTTGSSGTVGSSGISGGSAQQPGAGGAGVGSAGGGAPAAAAGPVGPGVTDKEIRIGLGFCNDCAGANSAIGGGGDDPGDTRRYYNAVIKDLNARGGILGRKLVPVFHEVSASDNIDTSAQAACERWTSDQKVLIMVFNREIVYECAAKAGAMVFGGGASGPVYDKYPNLFAPAAIRLERLYDVTVKAMVRAGWHKPEPRWPTGKIGLITWDNNDYRFAMKNGYLKAMGQAGLKAEEVRYVAVPQSANSIADASAAVSNAVLSFREKGIDHVLIGDGPAGIFRGVGLTFLFLSNSQSQGYKPRYGFNSNNGPNFANHPKEQLVGMIAIDSFNAVPASDQGLAPNPQRERCWNLMKKNGLQARAGQTGDAALNACEPVWFAEALLKRAQTTTLPRMIAGGEALGTSYRSPFNYGNRLGPGQHDGVALFRNLQFDEGCQCNTYTSKPYEP
jgi:hypothetical protein